MHGVRIDTMLFRTKKKVPVPAAGNRWEGKSGRGDDVLHRGQPSDALQDRDQHYEQLDRALEAGRQRIMQPRGGRSGA